MGEDFGKGVHFGVIAQLTAFIWLYKTDVGFISRGSSGFGLQLLCGPYREQSLHSVICSMFAGRRLLQDCIYISVKHCKTLRPREKRLRNISTRRISLAENQCRNFKIIKPIPSFF
jgi:hypothetical protein